MKPKLSILIPTVYGRERSFISLFNRLSGRNEKQVYIKEDTRPYVGATTIEDGLIEIIFSKDNKEVTIGEKRERLYHYAVAEYAWQIDDDDDIDEQAIKLILNAIKHTPDCVTFQEKCIINGQYYSSNHSIKYEDWGENKDGFDYVRTPFFKSVIKTDIARLMPVPHLRYGEDHIYARSLKPYLHDEIHIDKELYIYQHNSKPEEHKERYGFNRD